MPWRRRLVASLSHRRFVFGHRPVHVGFMVDKVKPEQVILRVSQFSPVNHRHDIILAVDSVL